MPFIHIKSLPIEEETDVSRIVKNISIEFSSTTGIQISHIHTTWEYFQSGYYSKGDKVSEYQPDKNFPIIVDLLTPDFNDLGKIEIMLESIANSISKNMNLPKNNIFINNRQAQSSMVFDDGKIVKW